MSAPRDSLRLAFGTLSVVPVRPPAEVDRRVAGWAMALAPLVGAVLGVVGTAVAWGLLRVLEPPLVAVLVVALLAAGTRLIHWDGLADTADGLGSRRPAGAALDVMHRSDIGPFGVFAVLAVFAMQVAALADLLVPRPGFYAVTSGGPVDANLVRDNLPVGAVAAVVVAAVLGRAALVPACRTAVPAARPDGLGAAVAGSVRGVHAAVGVAATTVVVVLAGLLDPQLRWRELVVASAAALVWALAATAYLRRRLGGMTGDTLGALVETTTAVALVVLSAG